VLRYEKQTLDQRITQLHDKLNPAELKSLQERSRQMERRAEQLSEQLKRGGVAAHKGLLSRNQFLLPMVGWMEV